MDWRTFPDHDILDALDYTEPHLTEVVAGALAAFPSHRGHLAARLNDLAGRGLAVFTLAPRPGWLRVPAFMVQSDGGGI